MYDTVPYRLCEIRAQAKILVNESVLTVRSVRFRHGRGLELLTSYADGYNGPSLYPHPDEPVDVLYMPSMSDDDQQYRTYTTNDYPWAE